MKKLWKAVDHNKGLVVMVIVCAALLAWTQGCESTVTSLTDPTVKVTRDELQLELDEEMGVITTRVEGLQRMATLKNKQLDRQDEVKQKIFELGAIVAEGGTVNPTGIIAVLGALLGVGAVVDNLKKDAVVRLKNKKK